MHFGLTEEQQLLQETVRGFASGECPPARLRELFDTGEGHDPALWKGLAEMGLTGLLLPEAHGGAGLGLLEQALVMEELGAAALPSPLLGHTLAGLAIALGGSDAQRARWLPALATGEKIAGIAVAEAEGWDPEAWALRLESGRLEGRKRFVPHARHADLLVAGVAGGGLAVVESGAAGLGVEDTPGVDLAHPLAELQFAGAAAEALAGDAGAAQRVRDAALVLLAADAFGAAWRLVTMTVDYAKQREQFGQPIAQFQAVKHELADMATAVEPSRALIWYAAHAFDALPDEAPRAAAVAKAHVCARACEVGRSAVELHGGIGFTWECDVQIWLKRALFDRAFFGTPEHQHARIAALADW